MEFKIPFKNIFWKQEADADGMGGIDPLDLEPPNNPNTPYFDKFHHSSRSLIHQPNHMNHFKKEGNIYKRK